MGFSTIYKSNTYKLIHMRPQDSKKRSREVHMNRKQKVA